MAGTTGMYRITEKKDITTKQNRKSIEMLQGAVNVLTDGGWIQITLK